MALTSSDRHWTNKYCAIPYVAAGRSWNGVDCWGLVYLVYLSELGIRIPKYSLYENTPSQKIVHNFVERFREEWVQLEYPTEYSIILFKISGKCCHMGIMLNDSEFMHCSKTVGVGIEHIFKRIWKNRIEGYYGSSIF